MTSLSHSEDAVEGRDWRRGPRAGSTLRRVKATSMLSANWRNRSSLSRSARPSLSAMARSARRRLVTSWKTPRRQASPSRTRGRREATMWRSSPLAVRTVRSTPLTRSPARRGTAGRCGGRLGATTSPPRADPEAPSTPSHRGQGGRVDQHDRPVGQPRDHRGRRPGLEGVEEAVPGGAMAAPSALVRVSRSALVVLGHHASAGRASVPADTEVVDTPWCVALGTSNSALAIPRAFPDRLRPIQPIGRDGRRPIPARPGAHRALGRRFGCRRSNSGSHQSRISRGRGSARQASKCTD